MKKLSEKWFLIQKNSERRELNCKKNKDNEILLIKVKVLSFLIVLV
jgi:hypothetical protein